jgi:hypothetical protein
MVFTVGIGALVFALFVFVGLLVFTFVLMGTVGVGLVVETVEVGAGLIGRAWLVLDVGGVFVAGEVGGVGVGVPDPQPPSSALSEIMATTEAIFIDCIK